MENKPVRLEERQRYVGLDIARIFALLCVIGVHFFLHTEFYDAPVAGLQMYIMVILRNFFMICIALFLLISGYLLGSKKLTVSYYLGLIRVISIYVLASLCCGVYRIAVRKEDLSVFEMLTGILSFSTAEYAWYVEMYIGLFLLAPLLNLMYDGLQTKKRRQVAIAILLVLTALPGVTNIFCARGLDWWMDPKIDNQYILLLPEYFIPFYPVTLYLMGCYLKDYPVKCGKLLNLALILALTLATGMFNIYRSYGTTFIQGGWQTWGSLPVVALAAAVFVFFVGIKGEKLPGFIKTGLKWLSNFVFGAYLVSWIFDDLFYPMLRKSVPEMQLRLEWFPVMVLAVTVCSLTLSAVVYGIYSITGGWLLKRTRQSFEK